MNRQAQANAEAGAQLRRTAHSYGLLEAMFDRAARRRHPDDLKSAARLFDDLVAEHSLPKGSGEAWRDGAVIRLPAHGKVIVVGDLHGDIESLHSILKASHFLERASESKDTYLLCLGDYVDRGPEPFAVLDVLVRLKTSFHSQVFLLCGNHETERLNRNFGFLEQCEQRNARDLYDAYNLAFVRLPLAATAPNGLVALHGGPSPKITSPADFEKPVHGAVHDLLWNDPSESEQEYGPNRSRGMGSVFGSKALDGFLSAVGGRVLVRSHEPVSDGARVQLGGKVLTVYSTRCGGLPVEKIAYAEIDLSKPLQNAGEIEVCRL